MPKYIVLVDDTTSCRVEVTANSEKEALEYDNISEGVWHTEHYVDRKIIGIDHDYMKMIAKSNLKQKKGE
tara:strand:- start:101 stop:310 length:210 start_codon:yes stop_codon:yes gene_type:complete